MLSNCNWLCERSAKLFSASQGWKKILKFKQILLGSKYETEGLSYILGCEAGRRKINPGLPNEYIIKSKPCFLIVESQSTSNLRVIM